jgi:hypothetical protein
LFTHCQSLPNFCHHQIVISITICSLERIGHHVQLNAASFLSKYGQFDFDSFHYDMSMELYECQDVGTLYF